MIENWPEGKFAAIYADPPWLFQTWVPDSSDRKVPYDTMTLEQIKAMPVPSICAPDCVLFMWICWPHLKHAMDVIDSWGFCVATGTKILTDDMRWIGAEEAAIGQRLLCFDDKLKNGRRYYRWGHVVSTGRQVLPCHKIYLSNGQTLVASNEHKWLAAGGPQYDWATAPRMMNTYNGRRKKAWMLPILAPYAAPLHTYDAGFLSAAFDSEGSVSNSHLTFAQKPNALMDRVQKLLREHGFSFGEYAYPQYHSASQLVLPSHQEAMRFLMQFQPPRLLSNWVNAAPRNSLWNLPRVSVEHIEDAGLREVVTLQTDVGTYIAEGFGAHNTYKTCAFSWIKADASQIEFFRDDVDPFMGMGYWTRGNSEVCLLATRGKPKRTDAGVRQAIIEPRREHSRKPDCVHERIERLVAGPYVELFARTRRLGWTSWGNQTEKFNGNGNQDTAGDPGNTL